MEYGLQLYSVRDFMEKDMEGTLKKVAELGYSSVEFAGFFGRTADEVNRMLADNGLKLSGTHSGFDDLVNNYDETVAYHKAIGNKHYIIPGYDLSTQAKIDAFVEKINPIIKKLKEDGIELSYHNHHREFIPNEDGSVIFDQLYYRTDLTFELDTYWAFVGMGKPLLALDRFLSRLKFIHLKDGDPKGHGSPLGKGDAPVADVYKYAVEKGLPMVVESETITPDGITEATICIEYLRKLEKEN